MTDGGVRPQLGWGGVWGGEGRWRLVLLMRPERFHKEITEKRMIRYRPGSYCTSDACVCMEESIRFMFEASYIRIHTRFDVRLVHITYTYCIRRVERLFDLFGVEQNKRHHENFRPSLRVPNRSRCTDNCAIFIRQLHTRTSQENRAEHPASQVHPQDKHQSNIRSASRTNEREMNERVPASRIELTTTRFRLPKNK